MKGKGERESPAHQARRAWNIQGMLDLLLFQHQHSADTRVGKYRELVRRGSPPENKRTFFRLGNVALSMELINTDVFLQVSISFPNFCAWKINNQADVPVASSQLTKLPPSSRMEKAGAPSSSCPPAPAQATAQPSSCSLPKHQAQRKAGALQVIQSLIGTPRKLSAPWEPNKNKWTRINTTKPTSKSWEPQVPASNTRAL